MGATPTYGWPFPDITDQSDGPEAFDAALTAVENTVKGLPTILAGTTDPQTSQGKNGDVYVKYQ